MPIQTHPKPSQALNRTKWTPGLMRAGWVLLPNVLIEKQLELGLDPVDLNIVLHLAAHWWVPDVLPRPSKARMAAAMDLSPRTLQRRLTALHDRGLVKRNIRGTSTNTKTNSYDLSGLIDAATPLALDLAKERARKRLPTSPKTARRKPSRRKKPSWM